MIARFDENEFCISLPDTPMEEAKIVMNRIAGIVSYTDFALIDVFKPISVWVEAGMANLEHGDTTDTLIEKARKNIA